MSNLGGVCQVGALKGRLERAPSPRAYATMWPRDIDKHATTQLFLGRCFSYFT